MIRKTFYCKNCGDTFFGSKEEVEAYKIQHYLRDPKYPRLKACRSMVRTDGNNMARPEVAAQILKEKAAIKAKENEKFDIDWDQIKEDPQDDNLTV